MITIYRFVLFSIVILAVYRIAKRDYFNFAIYAAFGFVLPLYLFHLDWSTLFLRHIARDFYLILTYYGITVLIVSCIEDKKVSWNISYSVKSNLFIYFYNFLFIVLCLVENYILSGKLFPFLNEVDVHTDRAGGILWITNTCYVVVAMDYLAFHKTKNYTYLLLALIGLVLPVVGKGSRIESVISLFQIGLLFIYLNRNKAKKTASKNNKTFFQKTTRFALVVVLLVLFSFSTMLVGEFRSKNDVSSESRYALSIGYSGPGEGVTKDMFAWYYGYFPFSFHNLNNNIISTHISPNWAGMNSFKALWFGLFRFSWFGYKSDYANGMKDITTTSATVVTMFWDYYYDYGSYCFIPIIIMGCFYLLLKKSICGPKVTIAAILIYCYWAGLCFFVSFNNVVFFDCVFTNMIIIAIVSNLAFQVDHSLVQEEQE